MTLWVEPRRDRQQKAEKNADDCDHIGREQAVLRTP